MHDELIPACDHCKKFIFAFAKDSPLSEWGFCLDEAEGGLPGQEAKRELEVALESGDRATLYNTKGLYEGEEEGCERFEPR